MFTQHHRKHFDANGYVVVDGLFAARRSPAIASTS